MKMIYLLLLASFSTLSFSNVTHKTIPHGKYRVEKIKCISGKIVNFGISRFFIKKEFNLEVSEGRMVQTLTAKSTAANPFNIKCTIVNVNEYTYTQESKFEGSFKNTKTKCNDKKWTDYMEKKGYGIENYGEFVYKAVGDLFTLHKVDTLNKYSCEGEGDFPVYYYRRIN